MLHIRAFWQQIIEVHTLQTVGAHREMSQCPGGSRRHWPEQKKYLEGPIILWRHDREDIIIIMAWDFVWRMF